MKANIGLIGVGVMGENLIMNMESRGYTVACYDVLLDKTKDFAEGRAKGKNIIPTYSLEEFVNSLERPRKIMIMIKAGAPVDSVIESLIKNMVTNHQSQWLKFTVDKLKNTITVVDTIKINDTIKSLEIMKQVNKNNAKTK